MIRLRVILHRVFGVFFKSRLERELQDELQSHIEMQIEENIESGMNADEARYAALRKFGGIDQVKESYRDKRSIPIIESLARDIRFSARTFFKNPVLTLTIILILALGIGFNAAIFSFVNVTLLQPLHYPQPEQLVRIYEKRIKQNESRENISYVDFIDWQQRNTVFESMSVFRGWSPILTDHDNSEQVRSALVSGNLCQVFRTQPILGRAFKPDDNQPGSNNIVLLSSRLWERHFSKRRDVIGKSILLNGEANYIIGVMPHTFQTIDPDIELWKPDAFNNENAINRGGHYYHSIGRLKPNVSITQAQAEMEKIALGLEKQYPDTNSGHNINLISLAEDTVGEIHKQATLLFITTILILLIGCANIANLQLSRGFARQKEIATRSALGASRKQIAIQLMIENLFLSLFGGLLGLLISFLFLNLLKILLPPGTPRLSEIKIDITVLAFTLFVSVISGLIFGLLPALKLSESSLSNMLRDKRPSFFANPFKNSARRVLLVTQVALTLIMLIGGGITAKSFVKLKSVNLGFNTDNIITIRMNLIGAKYTEGEKRSNLYKELNNRIYNLPGIQHAGMVSSLPFSGTSLSRILEIEGKQAPYQAPFKARFNTCNPDYFKVMEIPLLKGRGFSKFDAIGQSEVTIINEAMKLKYWKNEDPIGKRIKLRGSATWSIIIGIIGSTRNNAPNGEPIPEMYYSIYQFPASYAYLTVRASINLDAIVSSVQNEIKAIDPSLPTGRISALEQLIDNTIAIEKMNAILVGIFSVLGLLIASIGIYGALHYSASQRTQEIGIRLALGARSFDILKNLAGTELSFSVIGLFAGLVIAYMVTPFMKELLFGVSPTDAMVFVSAPIVLLIVALSACYLPARRATKIDPINTLRCD